MTVEQELALLGMRLAVDPNDYEATLQLRALTERDPYLNLLMRYRDTLGEHRSH